MRLALRWLASIAIFCLILYHVSPRTAIDLDDIPISPVDKSAAPDPAPDAKPLLEEERPRGSPRPSDIGAFWKKWSQAMYDARPRVFAISIKGQATTLPPNTDGPRKPYRDLVRNPEADLELMRKAHAKFVEELENIRADEGIFKGRGVVMVGGGEYFGPAIISIHMLRRTGSTLPVEVFVPNDEEYEVDVCEGYLPKLNAKCVVLAHVLSQSDAELGISHYQLKAPSLLFSSFEEVLLLDSDSIPVVDPDEAVFSQEPYLSDGLIVWPDYWAATESPQFWTIAGFPDFPSGLPATSSETGQLVVNKKTHLAPLLLATYYNVFGKEHYYPLLSQGALGQGDKETFMAAAVVLNTTYYRVKTSVASLGRHDGFKQKATAMVQHLPYDDQAGGPDKKVTVRPAFLHSNTPKMNAGHLVDEGDLLGVDGSTRLRLLGSKAEQEKHFGFDVESSIWDLLIQTGCELADIIKEWKHRDRLCERLEEHHDQLFGEHRSGMGQVWEQKRANLRTQ
ncbi:mannosyltransferase putative-domain-containing protein [Pseudomassariella vexata]|uniref:Mannosyltransferase putative-domain-containing protein n=1 Tax=Pseudomassariella vexata TaxID=1141098 RepID=A0A1Y2DFH1_9PEZI|nr:mannosyltransferase putative-domain-containing protein [Pseudomassariella vexata]ORY58033.1 mannosyltransferase putative-domain-containing protein [Pseudomassariella vexata]